MCPALKTWVTWIVLFQTWRSVQCANPNEASSREPQRDVQLTHVSWTHVLS